MKFAFDIDGVINKYPEVFKTIIDSLLKNNHKVIIITGRSKKILKETKKELSKLEIRYTKLYISPYNDTKSGRTFKCWQKSINFKYDTLKKEKVDMVFDDMGLYLEVFNKLGIPCCKIL